MGRTSVEVKERWNKKNYDDVRVRLPKGMKEKLKAVCEKDGISMNSIFVKAAEEYLGEE
jgi:predicted DNA-binding protein